MKVFLSLDDIKAAAGTELGVSDWLEIDQERIDRFAEATGDHQWIHVDPIRAESGPFGTTIAHGFLTLAMLPVLTHEIYRVEHLTMAVNYGLDRVRFPAPVLVGKRIRARATITSLDKISADAVHLVTRATIEVEGSDKPACVADMVSRYYFADTLTPTPAAGS